MAKKVNHSYCARHFPQLSPVIGGSFAENDLQNQNDAPPLPFCNTLQHAATHCNALQREHTARFVLCASFATATPCNTTQHAATRCNTLQHTATR